MEMISLILRHATPAEQAQVANLLAGIMLAHRDAIRADLAKQLPPEQTSQRRGLRSKRTA